MPLVFIHGVGNRMNSAREARAGQREALFREYLLKKVCQDSSAATILNPYWGEYGAQLHWDGASFLASDIEEFGAMTSPLEELIASVIPLVGTDEAPILSLAHKSLPEAVDLLWTAAALSEPCSEAPQVEDSLARESALALDYAHTHEKAVWLSNVSTDNEFVLRLEDEIEKWRDDSGLKATQEDPEWEAFGGSSPWGRIAAAVDSVRGAAVSASGKSMSDRLRPAILPAVAIFLGDVFAYINERGSGEQPITATVEKALQTASTQRGVDDPLIVIGHSMGGNIAYDLLTTTSAAIQVDLLVTVGSQVGLFEELKLFRASDLKIPGRGMSKVARPRNVAHWINVFDYSDLLGFSVGAIVDQVRDRHYRTNTLLHAHSSYFCQPLFHRRLAFHAGEIL
ncbi:lipase family protein [Streptomyces avermitilis]|uniref:hypothetical protein n=1 Tax=Streptomyces avermitilis TaxID=33903 RepID=UPI0037217987